jgi:hypothetical protein
MAFWWVNHGDSHKEEIDGGYIWSLKDNNRATYLNLTKACIADLVFSYAKRYIGAIGIVKTTHKEFPCPYASRMTGEKWNKDGWLVPIAWYSLNIPIEVSFYLDRIRPFLPHKYSPLDKNGNGTQKCYLAEISDDLGQLMLQLAELGNPSFRDVLGNALHTMQ